MQELFGNGIDGRSVGRKLSAIRHLYRYLLLDGMIETSLTPPSGKAAIALLKQASRQSRSQPAQLSPRTLTLGSARAEACSLAINPPEPFATTILDTVDKADGISQYNNIFQN